MLTGAWFQPLLNTSTHSLRTVFVSSSLCPLHRSPMWQGLKRLSSMDHAIIVILVPCCSHAVLHWVWLVRKQEGHT